MYKVCTLLVQNNISASFFNLNAAQCPGGVDNAELVEIIGEF